ncbi:MAG: hypothetical protein ACOCWB_08890 [Bacteroidota bacterium]
MHKLSVAIITSHEALSSGLCLHIQEIKKQNIYDEYTCNGLNHYSGQTIKNCSWFADVSLCVWHKNKGNWGSSYPHDIFIMNSSISTSHIQGDILHYTFTSIESHCNRINYFSTISTKSNFQKLHKNARTEKQ